jgi:phage tail-like protein
MAYPLVGFHFKVLFGDGKVIEEISFSKVNGIDFELITEESKSVVGSENIIKPKGYKYNDLVLSRGTTSKKSFLFKWLDLQASQGKILTLTLTVNLLNEKSEPVLSWTFFDSFPVKYSTAELDASSNLVLIESITLKYSSVKFTQIDYTPASSTRTVKKRNPGPIQIAYEKREKKLSEVKKKYEKKDKKTALVVKKNVKKDKKTVEVVKKNVKKDKKIVEVVKKNVKKDRKYGPVIIKEEKKVKSSKPVEIKSETKTIKRKQTDPTPLTISPKGDKSSRESRRSSLKKPPK